MLILIHSLFIVRYYTKLFYITLTNIRVQLQNILRIFVFFCFIDQNQSNIQMNETLL